MNKQLADTVRLEFIERFQTEPLLVFSPGRINVIGEHTDYNQGFVLPGALNMGIILALARSSSDHSTFIARDLDKSIQVQIGKTQKTASSHWSSYLIGVLSEIEKISPELKQVNVLFGGDLPIGAGLSSSAALENALSFGINKLFNLDIQKAELAAIGQRTENNYIGVSCGIMDQFASMFGEKDKLIFLDCRTLAYQHLKLNLNPYTFVLVHSGLNRHLSDAAYNNRRRICEEVAQVCGFKSLRDVGLYDLKNNQRLIPAEQYKKAKYVIDENERVHKAVEAIQKNDLMTLGQLITKSHYGLQHEYGVSCDELDFLVSTALKIDGVLGSRMMGGGFGGCTLNMVLSKNITNFKTTISTYYYKNFKIDCNFFEVHLSDGTSLINL